MSFFCLLHFLLTKCLVYVYIVEAVVAVFILNWNTIHLWLKFLYDANVFQIGFQCIATLTYIFKPTRIWKFWIQSLSLLKLDNCCVCVGILLSSIVNEQKMASTNAPFTKFRKGIESNLKPGVKHCARVCLCV